MSYQLILDLLARYFQRVTQVLNQKTLILILAVWTPILFLQTGVIQYLDSPKIANNYAASNKVDPQKYSYQYSPPSIPRERETAQKNENSSDWLIPVAIGAGAIALCLATGCLIP
jgi:hypothetical protein